MKTITKLSLLILIVGLVACENKSINPSKNVTVQDRTITDYTEIEISTAFTVDVTFSATEEKIEIETNENLHAYIDVYKSGDALIIKIKDNTSIQGNSTIKAHITTANKIRRISVRDASLLAMNNYLGNESVELSVIGASQLIGKINANTVTAFIEDASNVTLEGSADTMNLYANGASNLSGLEFIVKDVICTMSDATNVSLYVTDTIDLTASDASVFSHKGNAVIVNLVLKDAAKIVKLD